MKMIVVILGHLVVDGFNRIRFDPFVDASHLKVGVLVGANADSVVSLKIFQAFLVQNVTIRVQHRVDLSLTGIAGKNHRMTSQGRQISEESRGGERNHSLSLVVKPNVALIDVQRLELVVFVIITRMSTKIDLRQNNTGFFLFR